MKVRKLAGALLAGGVLAVVSLSAAPALAQPYPPGPCSGTAGVGFVSNSRPVVGSQIRFSACGFSAFASVVVSVTGANPFEVRADATGFMTTLLTVRVLGRTTIEAEGREGFPTTEAAAVTTTGEATFKAASDTGVATVGNVRSAAAAAAPARPLRIVTSIIIVEPPSTPGGVNRGGLAGGPGAPGAAAEGGFSLPFTGAETGALAGLALVLTGGGGVLRVVARRRRTVAAAGPPEGGRHRP